MGIEGTFSYCTRDQLLQDAAVAGRQLEMAAELRAQQFHPEIGKRALHLIKQIGVESVTRWAINSDEADEQVLAARVDSKTISWGDVRDNTVASARLQVYRELGRTGPFSHIRSRLSKMAIGDVSRIKIDYSHGSPIAVTRRASLNRVEFMKGAPVETDFGVHENLTCIDATNTFLSTLTEIERRILYR